MKNLKKKNDNLLLKIQSLEDDLKSYYKLNECLCKHSNDLKEILFKKITFTNLFKLFLNSLNDIFEIVLINRDDRFKDLSNILSNLNNNILNLNVMNKKDVIFKNIKINSIFFKSISDKNIKKKKKF